MGMVSARLAYWPMLPASGDAIRNCAGHNSFPWLACFISYRSALLGSSMPTQKVFRSGWTPKHSFKPKRLRGPAISGVMRMELIAIVEDAWDWTGLRPEQIVGDNDFGNPMI